MTESSSPTMPEQTQSPPDPPRMPRGGGLRPNEWKPWGTYGLIAANVAAFAFELVETGSLAGPGPEQMVALGGNLGPLTREGEPWRLVTAMFLHYGVIHIAMNMMCLYQVAIVERLLGRAEFLALYFASGLVGGLGSVAAHPYAVSAGASGAVFGMFGAFTAVMVVRRKQVDPIGWRRTMRSLGIFYAINLVFGLSLGGIDLTAHIVGLSFGFGGAFALTKTRKPGSKPLVRALLVAFAGVATAFGGLYALPR